MITISPGSSVEFEGVTKLFASVTAVDELSLSIPEGSIYGFIGPNGSGKTTSMRMIAGIFFPDRGNICVLGAESSVSRLGLIGYLPEERGTYKKMTVQSLLRFHADLRRVQNAAVQVDTSFLELLTIADCRSFSFEFRCCSTFAWLRISPGCRFRMHSTFSNRVVARLSTSRRTIAIYPSPPAWCKGVE